MWHYNLSVNSVFAHSLSQNSQANLSGLGWRLIATGDPTGVTRVFVLLSDAAKTSRKVHVFIGSDSKISSAQLS